MNRVYLDHNATSPLRPKAREAMLTALDLVGNPSSIHGEGRAARALIEDARETVAEIFGVGPSRVIFTSGGTEAANWLLQALGDETAALSSVEHVCVLQGHGIKFERVRSLPVNGDGAVELSKLEEKIEASSLVAVQAANNETGVIQPLAAVAEIARKLGGALITDAVQAIGRIPLGDLACADVLFFSAHKFGGPKGVGAVVFCNRDPVAPPLIAGGGQERRLRSGTENVAGIAGLAAALEAAIADQRAFAARTRALRDRLESEVRAIASDAAIFAEGSPRLSNTTLFAIPGRQAETMLIAFDLKGVAVSSGSACSSGSVEQSHVLAAMGVPEALSRCAIRVSSGWNTKEEDVERFLAALAEICGSRERQRVA